MKRASRYVSLGFLFVSEEHFLGVEAQKSRVYEDIFASKPQKPGWGEQGRCVHANDTDNLLNTDSTDKHVFRAKKRKTAIPSKINVTQMTQMAQILNANERGMNADRADRRGLCAKK